MFYINIKYRITLDLSPKMTIASQKLGEGVKQNYNFRTFSKPNSLGIITEFRIFSKIKKI